MRDRKGQQMEYTRCSRDLGLYIQRRTSTCLLCFKAPSSSWISPLIAEARPTKEGLMLPSFYIQESCSLETSIAGSASTTVYNKCRFDPVPHAEDTAVYLNHTSLCPLAISFYHRALALGWCFRSVVTLRAPTLKLLNLKMTESDRLEPLWHPRKNSVHEWPGHISSV